MDALTLLLVILVFLLSLGLYFATLSPAPKPPKQEHPLYTPVAVRAVPPVLTVPAVLRSNVAVARLLARQEAC